MGKNKPGKPDPTEVSNNPLPFRPHKYHAKRTHHAGRSFASKLEADLFDYLTLLVKGDELYDLQCQPHVFLTEARIEMIPDFVAVDLRLGQLVYFEAKGLETDTWRIKRKLWKGGYGPGRLRVYKRCGRMGLQLTEEIIPATFA